MKWYCVFVFFTGLGFSTVARAQPADPGTCLEKGTVAQNKVVMVSQIATAFTLNALNQFETAQVYSNNMRVNVRSQGGKYRLYVAGELTLPSGVTTPIPLNNFTVTPTVISSNTPNNITLSTPALSGAYQLLTQRSNATNAAGDEYFFTIGLSGMNTYAQAPGNYTLKFHFRLCHY
ncbi:hypothetical protein OQX61_18835 [Pedobacter sp. PLR]|uniref:hypothetical protein n=1 Tax=Pedobacter sp. PLR TaxID=2994465 RepID=UPI0022469EF1|nr:hypothetical protein [Pedobacter sp. PLR]MCX2453335.1 hypothetical protein [Pedobacter sp. PLR]